VTETARRDAVSQGETRLDIVLAPLQRVRQRSSPRFRGDPRGDPGDALDVGIAIGNCPPPDDRADHGTGEEHPTRTGARDVLASNYFSWQMRACLKNALV